LGTIKKSNFLHTIWLILVFSNIVNAQLIHFEPVAATGQPDAIVIQSVTINDIPIVAGDEIGVFDGTLCVGATVFNGSYNISVTAWREYTPPGEPALPGAISGNPMIFKVWQQNSNIETDATATLIPGYGDGTFGQPVTAISLLAASISQYTLSISDETENEDVGTMTFTVTLSEASPSTVSVNYQTNDGTAAAPADYTAVSGTLIIPAGNTTGTIDVPIIDDATGESNETFTVDLSNPVEATIEDNQGIGTIIDNDGIIIGDVTANETGGDMGIMSFTVTLPAASGSEVRVDYQTNNGTAVAPGDFTNTSGTLIIPAGTTTGTIDVPIIDDALDEDNETFTVDLSNPVNGTIADNQAIGTITDNDATPTISINDRSENENVGSMSFTVSLSSISGKAISVIYQTNNGTATSPNDYTTSSGTLTIPAGSTTGTINVPIVDDVIDENNETFTVDLSNPVNATIADNQGIGTIEDNDAPPTISINDESENENIGSMGFTVTLSAVSGNAVSVNYQTNSGTAVAPGDYATTNGILTIPAGSPTGTINVPIVNDGLNEGNENFTVDLSNPVNATITDSQGTGTIIDNDGPPTISISDQSGSEDVGTMSFTVNLSAASGNEVSLNYQTANGTAAAPGDYTTTSGILTIPAGNTSETINVSVIDDAIDENNETFYVNLSNPVNATIADNQAVGTINDNDAAPTISISDEIENEDIGTMVFTVTLSSASGSEVRVTYQTNNDVAVAPGDYTSTSGILVIPAGNTTGTVNVQINDDTISEPNETFNVNLSFPVNATLQDNQGVGTIVDNDGSPNITISDETENEYVGNMGFTVTLSNASVLPISVDYQTNDGTAIAPGDYTSSNGTLTIPAGSTSGIIYIPIIDDAFDEDNETFTVDLSNAVNATLADNQGIGTINDNEATPAISITDEIENENIGTMTFTITMSGASASNVRINYQTSDGTAEAPDDYTSTSGTLTIPTGSTTGTVNIPIIDDAIDENSESFSLDLSNPINATLVDNKGIGTINDNDDPAAISISDEFQYEYDNTMSFTVTLSTTSASAITVNYQTTNGSAVAPGDYTYTSGILNIPAGNITGTIQVPLIDDAIDENNEDFYINLSNPINATISDNQGVGTIGDNDQPPAITISDGSQNENISLMSFTVSLSEPSGFMISVDYQTNDISAEVSSDYSNTNGTLTLPAGVSSGTINVPIFDDDMSETNETFSVDLSNASNATITDNQGIGTIIDDDEAPTISVNDQAVDESVGNINFTVTISTASALPITVDYETQNGTAVAPGDFNATSGSLTIPAGSTTGSIIVLIVDDNLDESNENFTIFLSNPVNATLADNQGIGNIIDDEAPPTISISDESENEGVGNMTFTVTLSVLSGSAVSVSYQTSNNTATASADYTFKSGFLTIPAGSLTGTITIPILEDDLSESSETFKVNLSNAVNAAISDYQGVGTIVDNDALPTISITDETVNENAGNMIFTVSLSTASALTVSVSYETNNGTAIAPGDYISRSGSLTIPAGSTTGTISVPIVNDSGLEENEIFYLELKISVNATIADNQGVGTIVDNDGNPTITISDKSDAEDIGNMSFTVTLSNASFKAVSVNYQTNDGSATAPDDYTSTSGTLTIPAGNTTGTIVIPIVDDAIDENSETFTIDLSNPVNAVISDNQGTGTIHDNDAPSSITISDESENENIDTMNFTVSLSGSSGYDINVNYQTNDDSALEPDDYTSSTGTLTIPAGSTTGTISVPIIDDVLDEENENFSVILTNPVYATITDSEGIGTINDNDDPPTITIGDETENENIGTMSFTVILSDASGYEISVDFQTASGLASTPDDFTETSGTLILPAGSTSGTISIPIIEDTISEANETFTVDLTNPVNATIADAQGLGTIVDNDGTPNITISDEAESENIGNMSFTVTLSNASVLAVSVDYQTNDGTANAPGDYTSVNGTVTIPAGSTSVSIDVPIIDDALNEDDETFTVNLSNPINANVADDEGIGTINNDDAQPMISISDETENENVGTMSFTVTMTTISALPVSIDYQTNNNSAETPTDYTETSGTLTIPAGSTTGMINVPIVDDIFYENIETFTVDLSKPVNATIEDGQGIGSINDNDTPPTITISDEIESENAGNMIFTITLSSASGLDVSVNIQTVNGTAIEPGDYTATNSTATVPAGSTSTTVSIPIIDDAMLEGNENFFINVSNPVNATIVDNQGSGTIVDNDGSPNITISDETVAENISNMSFTVTLSNASYLPVNVDYQTNAGTAQAPNDYTTTTGTLTIQPGTLTGVINVPIIDDALDENNEIFYVNLSNPVNCNLADNQGLGTINDNDAPSTISIIDVEKNEDAGTINFTVNLSAISGLEINVSYQTVDGTAVTPGDYTNTNGVLVIPAGNAFGTISVPIVDDAIAETNETFTINLSNPVNATITDNQGIGVIKDNDPIPSITISDEMENEDVGTMNFTVTLSAVSELEVRVDYQTSDNTAIAPGDYTPTSGTLIIPTGSTTGLISVLIIDDNILESSETFTVNLTNPINAARADNQAVGTIVDNDGNPNISISDESVSEDVGTMNFTVTLSNASYLAVSVNYQTTAGTAEASVDFTTTSGVLTIPAGNTSGTISVPIIDDAIVESNETYTVDLNNPVNANIVDNQGIGTIIDNDGTPQISINDKTASENIGTMNFTVSMSAASSLPVSIDFQTVDGTAVSPADYAAMNSTLTIPAGNTSGTISVAIFNDVFDENNENFTINLNNPVNANIIDNQAVGTINDDDASPSISISDEIQNESIGNMSFSVTLSTVSGIDVSVYYQTANNTAVAPDDFTAVNNILTIPAGSTTGTINVPIIDDGVSEPNETFYVNLVNPENATTIIADGQGVGTIVDNDGIPNITISDEIKNENIGTMNFTVTLSNASASTVTVNFQTSDGTAVAPGDYNAVSGTLTIPIGSLTGMVHVPIIDDAISESNETFVVTLTNPTNTTIVDNQGTGTIVDNDGIPNIIINDETNDEHVGNMSFSVTLSSASASDVSVFYQTINNTAIAPGDFAEVSGTLTIPAGNINGQIYVPIVDDAISESNEIFFVNLVSPTNATVADNQAVGTIVDNDGIPTITISDETNNEDIGTMSFAVTLSTLSASVVSVHYQTINSSAIAPEDYAATSGILTIAAGILTGTINVQIVDDALDENNETFTVNLSNSSNSTIADIQGVGTIVDNDVFPTLSISNESEYENIGNMSFTVTLSKTSVLAIEVDYKTNDGTAVAPGDYTPTTGTLTIQPGVISTNVFIPIIDDNLSELNEIFTVNLNNPVYASLADAQGVGSIIDNEDADGDGITDVIEGSGDRDNDGIADLQDFDPSGWIYLEATGELVPGGVISITPTVNVNILDNGVNGYYRFQVSAPGDYTLTYTPPQNYIFSSTCLPQTNKLDVNPAHSNPYEIGKGSKDGANNKLTNWSCQENKYYFSFHLEPNDPIIINNNIPLQRPAGITLIYFYANVENDGIKISWATEFEPDNAGFNIYRSQQENSGYVKINTTLIPAQGNAINGSNYTYFDNPNQNGTYYYKLESVSLQGGIDDHGTISVIVTAVDIKKYSIPDDYILTQNYPNPFNPETRIEFGLPKAGMVIINIYGIKGQLVRSLVSAQQSAGNHSVKWNATDNSGVKVSSGIYFYSFKVLDLVKNGISYREVRRMILMK
jgi:hypothetical protein